MRSTVQAAISGGARQWGMPVDFPMRGLSTDNAAMIAAAAWPRLAAGEVAGDEMTALPQMKLG